MFELPVMLNVILMTLLVLLIKSDRLIWLDFSQHREKEGKKENKREDFNPESCGGHFAT